MRTMNNINKKIALFMGAMTPEDVHPLKMNDDEILLKAGLVCKLDDLDYHTNWDSLIPACVAIEKQMHAWRGTTYETQLRLSTKYPLPNPYTTPIHVVWRKVVECIDVINEIKNK